MVFSSFIIESLQEESQDAQCLLAVRPRAGFTGMTSLSTHSGTCPHEQLPVSQTKPSIQENVAVTRPVCTMDVPIPFLDTIAKNSHPT